MFELILKHLCVVLVGTSAYVVVHFFVNLKKEKSVASDRGQSLREAFDLCGKCPNDRVLDIITPLSPAVKLLLKFERRRMLRRIDDQLGEVLPMMANALKSGIALQNAVEIASLEAPEPVGGELGRIVRRMKLGQTVEEAFESFAERLPTDDVKLFVQSIEVLRRAGGNLIETFELLSSTMRMRRQVAKKVSTITAQGRFQVLTLLVMPWALAFSLYVLAPEYLTPLVSTRLGLFFIAIGIAMEGLGALWMKKIVTVKI